MNVAELIKALEKMPQDKTIIMFDGPAYYTPRKVYIAKGYGEDINGRDINGNVIID